MLTFNQYYQLVCILMYMFKLNSLQTRNTICWLISDYQLARYQHCLHLAHNDTDHHHNNNTAFLWSNIFWQRILFLSWCRRNTWVHNLLQIVFSVVDYIVLLSDNGTHNWIWNEMDFDPCRIYIYEKECNLSTCVQSTTKKHNNWRAIAIGRTQSLRLYNTLCPKWCQNLTNLARQA